MSGDLVLAAARCDLHSEREAAVRCPECRRDYCRECVAEHGGRLLCTPCLARLANGGATPVRRLARVAGGMTVVAALAAAWLSFYLLGRLLLALPHGVDPPAAPGPQAVEESK